LTECILKQAKILHENSLFLHKNLNIFLTPSLPFRSLLQIYGSATAGRGKKVELPLPTVSRSDLEIFVH